jgi:hypothetical protein
MFPVANTCYVPKCCCQSVYFCFLFGTSLSGYALPKASWAPANDVEAKECSRIKLIHFILVNTSYLQLHSFWATGVSSGLATKMTRASRGRFGEFIIRGWTCFWFNFCTAVRDGCRLLFKLYTLYVFLDLECRFVLNRSGGISTGGNLERWKLR